MGRLKIVAAWAIFLVWLAVYGSWILKGMPQPSPPPELSGLLGAAMTVLFGSDLKERARRALGDG